MTLLKILKEENKHELIKAIFDRGDLSLEEVIEVLELILKRGASQHIDLRELIEADSDEIIETTMKNYVYEVEDFISKYESKASLTMNRSFENESYLGCKIDFGNCGITILFGFYYSILDLKCKDGELYYYEVITSGLHPRLVKKCEKKTLSLEEIRIILETIKK